MEANRTARQRKEKNRLFSRRKSSNASVFVVTRRRSDNGVRASRRVVGEIILVARAPGLHALQLDLLSKTQRLYKKKPYPRCSSQLQRHCLEFRFCFLSNGRVAGSCTILSSTLISIPLGNIQQVEYQIITNPRAKKQPSTVAIAKRLYDAPFLLFHCQGLQILNNFFNLPILRERKGNWEKVMK